MNYIWLLFFLVLINILVLVWFVVWRIVFRGKFRRMIMSFLGLLIEVNTDDHAGEPVEMDTSEHRADKIKQQAEALSFEQALEQTKPPEPEQAIIPPEERGELARDTSDSGWPRELDEETRRDPRPFRDVHLQTETVENIADFDEEESDNETSSDATAD